MAKSYGRVCAVLERVFLSVYFLFFFLVVYTRTIKKSQDPWFSLSLSLSHCCFEFEAPGMSNTEEAKGKTSDEEEEEEEEEEGKPATVKMEEFRKFKSTVKKQKEQIDKDLEFFKEEVKQELSKHATPTLGATSTEVKNSASSLAALEKRVAELEASLTKVSTETLPMLRDFIDILSKNATPLKNR